MAPLMEPSGIRTGLSRTTSMHEASLMVSCEREPAESLRKGEASRRTPRESEHRRGGRCTSMPPWVAAPAHRECPAGVEIDARISLIDSKDVCHQTAVRERFDVRGCCRVNSRRRRLPVSCSGSSPQPLKQNMRWSWDIIAMAVLADHRRAEPPHRATRRPSRGWRPQP